MGLKTMRLIAQSITYDIVRPAMAKTVLAIYCRQITMMTVAKSVIFLN